MVVRWTRKRSNSTGREQGYALGVVVENEIPKPGAARQDASIRLGVVEERYLSANVRSLREFHQGLFWASVDKHLDELRLNPVARARIEQEVSQKIARPPREWALWGVICVPKFDG